MEKFSVILPVYKDEENAEKIINSLKKESIPELEEVIAIVDESSIISEWSKLTVIENRKRVGKSKAINQGLEECKTDLVVLLSSDIDIKPSTVKMLAKETSRNDGITSPKIQSFPEKSESAEITETIWQLHHHVSNIEPKLGEAIAFRPDRKIPEDTVADEEYIASRNQKKNYIKSEKVFNYPPSSLKELYKQRRRVFCGHLKLAREEQYYPPTMRITILLYSLKSYLLNGGKTRNLLKAALIEVFARLEAFLWEIRGRTKTKWSHIETTYPIEKNLSN